MMGLWIISGLLMTFGKVDWSLLFEILVLIQRWKNCFFCLLMNS